MASKTETISGSVPKRLDRRKVLNFNIGVLGHVDSGKTSLGKFITSL